MRRQRRTSSDDKVFQATSRGDPTVPQWPPVDVTVTRHARSLSLLSFYIQHTVHTSLLLSFGRPISTMSVLDAASCVRLQKDHVLPLVADHRATPKEETAPIDPHIAQMRRETASRGLNYQLMLELYEEKGEGLPFGTSNVSYWHFYRLSC